jgi:hypothetical protein
MLVRVKIPVQAGNRAIKSGALSKVIQAFVEKARPEAVYFGLSDGARSAFVVMDMTDPATIPPLFEPLFMELDAELEMTPLMDMADVQKGLAAL